jgi:hypothetical protein
MIHLFGKHPSGDRPGPALAFYSLIFTALVAGAFCALAADGDGPVTTHQLLPGVSAEIQADGTLILRAHDSDLPLLTAGVPGLDTSRRLRLRGKQEVVRDLLTEGAAGGLRGFSSGADDDGDGARDEDRRDGRDNDGDGLVDEDYAAISDHMTVVHRREGSSAVHQESYHWSHAGLRSAVFLSVDSDRVDPVALQVATEGASWIEAPTQSLYHQVSGRPASRLNHPFVTRLEDVPGNWGSAGRPLWLGVMVLGDHSGYRARSLDSSSRLDFPVSGEPVPVVIAAARSWWQLSRVLADADLVFRGVADPLNKQQVGWIVPASCNLCRTAGSPAFTHQLDGSQELVLRMQVESGQSALVDPDLFALDGAPLGSPVSITWLPEQGAARRLGWGEVTMAGLVKQPDPLALPHVQVQELAGHQARGTVEFRFLVDAEAGWDSATRLTGFWLDGRPLRTEVMAPGKPSFTAVEPVSSGEANLAAGLEDPDLTTADTREMLAGDRHPPTLAAELLASWPNPFQDVISIRFKVPQNVGEAFAWVDPDDRPKNLDSQAAVPWSGGNPTASVRIYNIHGQEIMTLHDAMVAGGEVTVSWNGTDIYGRQVASGTYLCKLQMDEWSVTRRIIYLR